MAPPPPAPCLPPPARPSVIVRPSIATVSPSLMLNTRFLSLPLMARRLAPGPSMSRLLSIVSWSLVSTMVWPARPGAKTIRSPLLALVIRSRSEPAPLSRLFRTVRVLGTVRSSRVSSRGTNDGRRPAGRLLQFLRKNKDAMIRFSIWERSAIERQGHHPGVQTGQRGEARPVRVLLGGGHAPAAWYQ